MILLTRTQAADAALFKEAMERAASSGVAIVISPPGDDRNVYLTREQASDHQEWLKADQKAKAVGGTVVTLDT